MTSVYRLLFVLLFALPLPAAAQTIAMSGTVSYSISGSTVVLGVDRIDYTCPVGVTGRSGTLRVSLWASATPYVGVAQPGYMLAEYTVGELGCNQFFSGVSSGSITFAPPPDGTWHMTMMLEEFDGIYYVVDYLAFDRTETFGGQSVPDRGRVLPRGLRPLLRHLDSRRDRHARRGHHPRMDAHGRVVRRLRTRHAEHRRACAAS